MSHLSALSRLPAIVLVASLLPISGCVALNIPSQRFDDPADSGGLLGPWHTDPLVHSLEQAEGCLDGGPLSNEPLLVEQAPESDVPWPRFHPLPTRPVFGPTAYLSGCPYYP